MLIFFSVGGKRKKNTANWKKEKRKRLRAHGKEYEQARKKNGQAVFREARRMRAPCPEKCLQHCRDRITEEERQQLFDSYWGSGQTEAQRQLIKDSIDVIKQEGKRNTNKFHLRSKGQRIQVCKTMFINTYDIKDKTYR